MKLRTSWTQSRVQYWSCTKFADWIRGTPKPGAETAEGWSRWRRTAKIKRFRYWLAEEGLDAVQNFLHMPTDILYSIKYYINNRWVTKTHALTAHPQDIPRGEWRDVGSRFLPCLFNELRDYVEVELAWSNIAWSEEARAKYNPPWWAWGWFRWRTWRCPQAGLDHLHWETTLTFDDIIVDEDDPNRGKPTHQALRAKEVLELYHWWLNVYPQRPDPHEASGWSALCDARRQRIRDENDDDEDEDLAFLGDDRTPEERDESRRVLDLCHKIEQQYEDEDTEMMIRLIKIRNGLWT